MNYRIICVLFLLFIHPTLTTAQSESAESVFNQGMVAFNAQDYARALQFFLQARELGLQNKRLPYNLGVTYYKLQNYQKAYVELQAASSDPQLTDIAHFNMGLAAYKLHDTALAGEHFKTSLQLATTQQQRQLAIRMLEKLEIAYDAQDIRTIQVLAKVGLGYNDNVTLQVDEDAVRQDNERADRHISVYADISKPIGRNWFAQAGLYSLNYSQLHDYNYQSVQFGLGFPYDKKHIQFEVNTRAAATFFGGERFQDVFSVRLGKMVKMGAQHNLEAYYRFTRYESRAAEYEYLQGSAQQLELSALRKSTDHYFKVYYLLEDNRREDFDEEGIFSSHSPIRHSLGLTHKMNVAAGYVLDWGLEYRRSEYPEKNIFEDASALLREDDRRRAYISLMYKFNQEIWLTTDLEYLNNDSSISAYHYSANNFSLNLIFRN